MSANDSIGGMTFGRISRPITRPFFAPSARDAVTNSRLANVSVLARTTRVSGGIDRTLKTRITNQRRLSVKEMGPISKWRSPPSGAWPNVTSISASTRAGNASRMSMIVVMNVSVRRRW